MKLVGDVTFCIVFFFIVAQHYLFFISLLLNIVIISAKYFEWANFAEQAWRERDAALLRDQMAQAQMYSMREKLEAVESAVKNVNKNTRDE